MPLLHTHAVLILMNVYKTAVRTRGGGRAFFFEIVDAHSRNLIVWSNTLHNIVYIIIIITP